MSGLTAVGKGAKLEDSNLAAYGSKEHKDSKLAAAKTEKAWEGAGKEVGIQIWRIEKFKVKHVDKKTYGTFYNGDSYIILNTYKPDPESAKLAYNVHFWLGKDTTQDEAGTAAYKTVELDDLLGDVPVQYREVEGFESDEFKSCFPGGQISTLSGGIASGFNNVKPTEYKPRLLHIKGKKKVAVREVKLAAASLNDGDTFVLDNGLDIIQWNGKKAGMFEKRKGGEIIATLKDERNGKAKSRILDGLEDDETFWKLLGGKPDAVSAATPDTVKLESKKKMMMVSDESGTLKMTDCDFKAGSLKITDVFLVDIGTKVYAWIGKRASKDERAHGIKFASDYLAKAGRPMHTPIIRVMQGAEPKAFHAVF